MMNNFNIRHFGGGNQQILGEVCCYGICIGVIPHPFEQRIAYTVGGTTLNLPIPAGSAGDTYRYGFDRVVLPVVERFAPDWLLVSAGYDAHRADPLTDLGLTSGDYADLTAGLVALVPRSRCILFLEGGYDLDALAASAGASVAAAIGVDHRPEPASGDGPGRDIIDRVVKRHGLTG